jgi:hypothetical protein
MSGPAGPGGSRSVASGYADCRSGKRLDSAPAPGSSWLGLSAALIRDHAQFLGGLDDTLLRFRIVGEDGLGLFEVGAGLLGVLHHHA